MCNTATDPINIHVQFIFKLKFFLSLGLCLHKLVVFSIKKFLVTPKTALSNADIEV